MLLRYEILLITIKIAIMKTTTIILIILLSAASIWFEIWGSWTRVKTSVVLGKFPKNFDSIRHFHKQKIDFSGQISEKILFFSGNFTKHFDFSS